MQQSHVLLALLVPPALQLGKPSSDNIAFCLNIGTNVVTLTFNLLTPK